MFSCSACVRRAVLSLATDRQVSRTPFILPVLTNSTRPRVLLQPTTAPHATSTRSGSTLRSLRKGHHRKKLVKALLKDELPPPNTRRNKAIPTPVEQRDRRAREANANHLAVPDHQKKLARQASKEAQYLVDPMRLADEVQRNLRNDTFDKAIALVRASEVQGLKDGKERGQVNNIVSWNHLCDWCMAKHDPQTALKIYNEMKKRGHRPDAHTYTIMLRGFGENIRKPNAVSDAMKVYNSMFEPNSSIRPNVIHNNAIISVCAKGGKMDEMWSVAGRLPDKGLGSADHVTYTTILKALERDTIAEAARCMAKKGEGEDAGHIFDRAADDGRKLWRDVIIKWRRADLRIDETLVCAMGRLLLLSKKRRDVLDVFRLVEQTMGLRPGKTVFEEESEKVSAEETSSSKALTVFEPVPIASTNGAADSNKASSVYVSPGRNTVSMLMEAALLTKQPHVGKSYWYLLTSSNREYRIAPDANNIVSYLRLLRFSRSSSDIIEILTHPWPSKVRRDINRRGVYVIAMSTCVRDKNNPNIFRIAGKVVDIMQHHTTAAQRNSSDDADIEPDDAEDDDLDTLAEQGGMLEVDPRVMAMYLNLAMYTTRGINPRLPLKRTKTGDLDFEREPSKNNTFRALRRMGPDTINLRRLLKMKMVEFDMLEMKRNNPRGSEARTDYGRVYETLEDLLGLMRAMISAYDRILVVNVKLSEQGLGPLPKDMVTECRLQKAKLASYLGKVDEKILKRANVGKAGVWEGYDPQKINGGEGSRTRENHITGTEEGEDGEPEEVKRDYYLQRTVSGARLKKAVKTEEKRIEREEASRSGRERPLSRRQKQEKEKQRREERLVKLRAWDVKARTERAKTSTGRNTGRKSVGSFVQRGWGGGFEAMAKEMGQRDSGKMMDLGR